MLFIDFFLKTAIPKRFLISLSSFRVVSFNYPIQCQSNYGFFLYKKF